MKNHTSTFSLFIVILLQLLFFSKAISQTDSTFTSDTFKPSVTFAADVFPLDLNINFCVNFDPKFSVGIFGELGINFSHYFLAAGEHFAEGKTIIKYNGRDRADGEAYYGLLGLGLFCRFNAKKNHTFDLGFQTEVFAHYDDSYSDPGFGTFTGIFTTYHLPSKWKEKIKNGEYKRRPSFGIRLSLGRFKESSSISEFGVMSNLWCRIYLNYNKRYQKI